MLKLISNGFSSELQKQLKMGEKIESEHKNTILKLISDTKNKKDQPLKVYYQSIAKDHLGEIKDYYTRLKAMEDQAKRG